MFDTRDARAKCAGRPLAWEANAEVAQAAANAQLADVNVEY